MRGLLVVVIFIISFQAYCEINVIQDSNRRIVLQGNDCREVAREVLILTEWASQEDGVSPNCLRTPQVVQNGSICQADVHNCVPRHVRRNHQRFSDHDGPNCWNLALEFAGILPSFRLVGPNEVTHYMNSPLCQRLSDDDTPLPGDLGAVREAHGEEVHGFIYVSENLVYSKNGSQAEHPIALQTASEMFGYYPIGGESGATLEYYRCQSMSEYLNSQGNIRREVRVVLSRMEGLECRLEPGILEGDALTPNFFALASQVTQSLAIYLDEHMIDRDNLNDEEEFVLGSVLLRYNNLYNQLNGVRAESNLEGDPMIPLLRDIIRTEELLGGR